MTSTTRGFALSAAVTVLFNTALAWVKDSSPALTAFMKSIAGHHWTTHGLADLIVFLALGFVFSKSKPVQRIDEARLTAILVAATLTASLGLVLWFAFV